MASLRSKVRDLAIVLAIFFGGFALCFAVLSIYIIKVKLPRLPPNTGAVYGVVSPSLVAGLVAAVAATLILAIRKSRRH